MKLNEIRPMLWMKDLRGSVEFYTRVLAGMREFAIYDNNGYLLQFGQEIDEQS